MSNSAPDLLKREKISEKITRAVAEKKPFFSFEYFVPKTPEGILNLFGRIQRMGELAPLFVDVTWGAVSVFFFFFFPFTFAHASPCLGRFDSLVDAGHLLLRAPGGGPGHADASDVHQHGGRQVQRCSCCLQGRGHPQHSCLARRSAGRKAVGGSA